MSNLLYTTTAEADARLIRKDNEINVPGFKLIREWSHIDATLADTLMAALDAVASYTNPQADGQAYTGTFVNSKVIGTAAFNDPENGERYVNIVQELVLVASPADTAALAALAFIVTQENEILLPFGLQDGEQDTFVYVWQNLDPAGRATLMAIADSALVSGLPGAGWTYVDRKFEEQEDGTAKFSVVFRKMAWNAWGHDAYAADLTEYDNAGTTNEREIITKTWNAINNADLATAVSNARTGTNVPATAGYIIFSVGVRDGQDGSFTLTQRQKKQLDTDFEGSVGTPGGRQIRPFSWNGGTVEELKMRWEHFATQALLDAAVSAGAGSIPAGYTVTEADPTIDADGFYSMVHTLQKVTFDNETGTSPNKVLGVTRTFALVNQDPDAATFGIDASNVKGGDGVPIAAAAEIVGNQTAEAGHVVSRVVVEDNGDGSASIRKYQDRALGTSDEYAAEFRSAAGRNQAMETIVWRNQTLANADAIYADALAGTFAYHAAPVSHVLHSVSKDPEGNGQLYRVTRVTFIPKTFAGVDAPNQQGEIKPWRMDSVVFKTDDRSASRTYVRRIDRKVTSSLAAAKTWADGSARDPVNPTGVQAQNPSLGWIEYNERYAVWVAYKVRLDVNGTQATPTTFTLAEPFAAEDA